MLNRATKLNIAQSAASIHQRFKQRDVASHSGKLDVFGIIESLEIPLLFKSLDGLLGAYLPEPTPGVLITTQRPLSIQRFTAAHELGHACLGHKPSLDDESILRRMANPSQQQGLRQEEEANFFATTFMLPVWLVNQHASRQGWEKRDLSDPFNLYQLSLRVGLSYVATCVALRQHNLISDETASDVISAAPRMLKKDLLRQIEPASYYGDVWNLSSHDNRTRLEPQLGDHFVLELLEQSGAGYQWDISEIEQSGATILQDERARADDESVGSPVERRITLCWEESFEGEVTLQQYRPWLGVSSAIDSLIFHIAVNAKIKDGLSIGSRRRLLEAA
jgi:Zn-dependent peptidase ImmA (M78 family)